MLRLLPCVPQHQNGKRKYKEKYQSLGIHCAKKCFLLRNRVVSAGVPGMTTAQSPHRQPAALSGTVALQRFESVRRTRRMKSATGPEQRTDEIPIDYDRKPQQPPHYRQPGNNAFSSCATSAGAAGAMSRTSRSTAPSRPWQIRNHSRTNRLMQLRPTASGTYRLDVVRPSRAYPTALGQT